MMGSVNRNKNPPIYPGTPMPPHFKKWSDIFHIHRPNEIQMGNSISFLGAFSFTISGPASVTPKGSGLVFTASLFFNF